MVRNGYHRPRRVTTAAGAVKVKAPSVQYIVSYDDPAADRKAITQLIAAGVTHIVLSLRSPYPSQAARWLVDEIITPVRSTRPHGLT